MVKPVRSKKQREEYSKRRLDIARQTRGWPYRKVIQDFGFDPRYWRKKLDDKNFHPMDHGGKRYSMYTDQEMSEIKEILFQSIVDSPITTLGAIMVNLKSMGIYLSKSMIGRIFKEWKWSWKKPDVNQILKYTEENMQYYHQFQQRIASIDWQNVICCDEVSFVSRKLRPPRSVALKTWLVQYTTENPIKDDCNLIVAIQFNGTINIRVRETAESFIGFVEGLIENGTIGPNKVFLIDNATIPTGVVEQLEEMITNAGAQLLFLPKYSPELNPIELLYARIKKILREQGFTIHFLEYILRAFFLIPSELIQKFYLDCFCPQPFRQQVLDQINKDNGEASVEEEEEEEEEHLFDESGDESEEEEEEYQFGESDREEYEFGQSDREEDESDQVDDSDSEDH